MTTDAWGNSSEPFISSNSLELATPLRRFSASLLEGVLAVVTLGIGWFIWWLILLGKGMTPARQILGLVVLNANDRTPANSGQVFVRGALVYFGAFQLISFALSLILFGAGLLFTLISSLLVFRTNRQTLWDQITNTTVGYKGK